MSQAASTLTPAARGWRIVIIDFVVAVLAGVETQSFAAFFVLLVVASFFAQPDRPFSSGLLRLALFALGISGLISLFGGDDCDCDF